jgi:hypothetical protein
MVLIALLVVLACAAPALATAEPAPDAARVTLPLDLPAPLSPGARLDADLAAESAWEVAGATLATERVDAGRRQLELAPVAGERVRLTLRRAGAEGDEEVLAHTTTLVVLEARSDGLARRDAVVWEVARGGLAEFAVAAPPGYAALEVATDEGAAVPARTADRLLVRRERRLAGTGFLVASSAADPSRPVALASFEPAAEVRARFLAFAARSAARHELDRRRAWQRIDSTDLPEPLAERIRGSAPAAVYRFVGAPGEEGSARVASLPVAAHAGRLVARRETTTVLTAEGRLVHRDRLVLPPEANEVAIDLLAGAELWSARVAEAPVRPLVDGARIVVPLLPSGPGGAPTVAEVVTLAPGTSARAKRLALALPMVDGTVVEHRWRIGLPEGRRYRLLASELETCGFASGFGRAAPVVTSANEPEPAPPPAIVAGGGSGAVFGQVADDKGQPLPGVTLTLTGASSPLVQTSDARGDFRFVGLASGTYRLEGTLDGFGPGVFEQVIVGANRSTTLDLTRTAAVSETITITAESPLLDARKITTGATVDRSWLGTTGGYDLGWRSGRRREPERPAGPPALATGELARELAELRAGLVGGVRPIAVELPEKGKLVALVGILPPAQVTATLGLR